MLSMKHLRTVYHLLRKYMHLSPNCSSSNFCILLQSFKHIFDQRTCLNMRIIHLDMFKDSFKANILSIHCILEYQLQNLMYVIKFNAEG